MSGHQRWIGAAAAPSLDGGGRRSHRLLEHGELRVLVLALLGQQPRHGYELMRELEDRSGGAYRPSPGVVYPTLAMLEDEGLARQTGGEAGRKLYEITPAGRDSLGKCQSGVEAASQRLAQAAAANIVLSPKVARAMENLRVALRLRLSRGDLTEAEADAVAAALDGAASQVERT